MEALKRRHLLRALAGTPVLPHRSARVASDVSSRVTLGAVVSRDPVYAPPTSMLGRIGAAEAQECAPPRRNVLVATKFEHPPQAGIDPLLGSRALHPPRSAANLLHQLLRGLWSLDGIPAAEMPAAGQTEGCGGEQRPPRSSVPLDSQVPPPEEVVEVAEPPQAEARRPQTCERPCGPVGPGSRQLAAKAGKSRPPDPECSKEHKFEGEYTPFVPERPDSRGKPGTPCPCECHCTPKKKRPISAAPLPPLPGPQPYFFHPVYIPEIDGGMEGFNVFHSPQGEVLFADGSLGTRDDSGAIAVHWSGTNPTLDALRGGQSQGLGVLAGRDLDLGLMRPALSLTSIATAGIPGRAAIAAPELPDGEGSLILARHIEDGPS